MAFEVLHSTVTHRGRLSRLRVDRIRFPDGHEADREVVEHPSAVAVVALDAAGRVVLLRQYRHPVGEALLEIPAGILDVDGEPPEDAARRELVEEAGVQATGPLVQLSEFRNSAGWTDECTTVYLAEGVEPARAPDGFTPVAEEADMQVVWLPFPEVVTLARARELTDAKTLIGVLLAAAYRGDIL